MDQRKVFVFFKFYNNAVTSLTPKVPQLRRRSKERRNQEGVFYFSSAITTAHIIQLPRPVKGNWTD